MRFQYQIRHLLVAVVVAAMLAALLRAKPVAGILVLSWVIVGAAGLMSVSIGMHVSRWFRGVEIRGDAADANRRSVLWAGLCSVIGACTMFCLTALSVAGVVAFLIFIAERL